MVKEGRTWSSLWTLALWNPITLSPFPSVCCLLQARHRIILEPSHFSSYVVAARALPFLLLHHCCYSHISLRHCRCYTCCYHLRRFVFQSQLRLAVGYKLNFESFQKFSSFVSLGQVVNAKVVRFVSFVLIGFEHLFMWFL